MNIIKTTTLFPKVSNYLNLSDITLHLAVCLFDRTLANAELDEKQLQLTAITCLHPKAGQLLGARDTQ